jgi:hypothetical protein
MRIHLDDLCIQIIRDFGLSFDDCTDEEYLELEQLQKAILMQSSSLWGVESPYLEYSVSSKRLVQLIVKGLMSKQSTTTNPRFIDSVKKVEMPQSKVSYSSLEVVYSRSEDKLKAEEMVNRITDVCCQCLIKNYNIPRDWRPTVKVDVSVRRKVSCGGVKIPGRVFESSNYGFISIAASKYLPKNFTGYVPEYKSYESDPVIGAATTRDWRIGLMVLVSHEVSHALQYYIYFSSEDKSARYKKPHGDGFKEIYALLRSVICNPQIVKRGGSIGISRKEMLAS